MKLIEGRVFYSLRLLFALLTESGEKFAKQEREKINFTKTELKRMEGDIEKLREDKIRQYEAYAGDVITREAYIGKKRELDAEIGRIEHSMAKQKIGAEEENGFFGILSEMIRSAKKFLSMNKLTREMAVTFIEAVYVFDKENVEIVFKNDKLIKEIFEKYA